MFNWVVKVVPQPPEVPRNLTDEAPKTSAAEPSKNKDGASVKRPLKNTDEASEVSQNQTAVLGWLSNGFVSALPQPNSPGLNRANVKPRSGEDAERSGVIGWVTQGLTKVLPQPDEKYKETESKPKEETTEVYEVTAMPDCDALSNIPVVEMQSEDEVSQIENPGQFSPNVVSWLKQIIPQSILLPPGAVPVETSPKLSCKSVDKTLSSPPESLSGISLDTDGRSTGVVGWFVSGLGLKMPQPITSPKDNAESQGPSDALQKATSKLQPEMTLDDMDTGREGQQKQENQSKASAITLLAEVHEQQVSQQTASILSQQCSGGNYKGAENTTKVCQEDAETQTGRWTPFIESIKKEAEGVALATMEERLLQERVEMARVAEEVARQTAEMAIRQMTRDAQSIKLSLGSQDLQLEHETEQEETVAEEEREETEESTVKGPEPEEEAEPRTCTTPPTCSESVKSSKVQPQPQQETDNQESGPNTEPVTQQPQKSEDSQCTNADKAGEKEEEPAGEGCDARVSCDAFKTCLMRIPHTSECLSNISAFFKENGISAPKIPSMPKLPTQLSDITKYLPSLPPELRQELSQIRLTQVPRNIVQTVTEFLPKSSEGSSDLSLPSLSQNFSSIQQKFSKIPSQTQQYLNNIRNRLNSLMPQDV
ncbi:uncharacterized protein LOC117516055 isoform X2 [Thalassophryne amazonica]|uniref:uncharacterized protein LOC117516055 isoform X2 n=1 Tax=Thalassophryne amazonica TaxID=390379 RepID=UPI001470DEC4|nr:uncharacterized protein LOC117516055 isoform X2 [Thalassophryne amazonica]